MLSLLITAAVAVLAFRQSRRFVADRLRYVEAAQGAAAPVIAGVVAAVIALPVVGLLPLVGTGTAITFGVAVGAGVASGQRGGRAALPPGT